MSEIRPARCTFDGEVLRSEDFGDIYFAADDGPAESRYVFIDGNSLPQRWENFSGEFTIIETGFGSGLNFLLTGECFLEMSSQTATLNFISFEKYPIERELLNEIYAIWDFAKEISAELLEKYPPLVAGMHKISLAGGRVNLSLFFGDVIDGLTQLTRQADCWFLDGFAPDCNETMWSPEVFELMAKNSKPAATLATFTAAGCVKKPLRDNGFVIKRRPGFGRKWHMLVGRYGGGEK